MKRLGLLTVAAAVALSAAVILPAQESARPLYLDPAQPAEKRAADLVSHLTLDEKLTQLVNQSRPIPRLKIAGYDWWSESLHGVLTKGSTEFPEPVGLAATFDPAGIHAMGEVISTEGRIKNAQAVRNNPGGTTHMMEGLDFWAPNLNIFRDPRWGRGQETYGEDPFLTGRMGVAFVTGMQGDDPRYYRVIATPKHFAVHSGPESTRHVANVPISKHDELDTYLPAFRAAVVEGKAGSVMCAYNSINNDPACASPFLLQDQLRQKWGFRGYVVSDCGAIIDVFNGHHYKPTQAEASAISLRRGMDNECIDWTTEVKDDHDYKPYADAIKQGLLKESDLDTTLTRLFTARIKLGQFDPPEMVPYTRIDEHLIDSAGHRQLARQLANESMVLLKNDGVLPLKTQGTRIALVGPLAEQTHVLLGNYNGTPTHTVSILEGMKKEFPEAKIDYVEGTQFLSKRAEPIPAELFTSNGKPGLLATYSPFTFDWSGNGKKPEVLLSRVEPKVDVTDAELPASLAATRPMLIHWEGTLTPRESGDYLIGAQGWGFFRLNANGKEATTGYDTNGVETKLVTIHLEAGKPIPVTADYGVASGHESVMRLVWRKVDLKPQAEAIAAAQNADVVVAVVGITSELEGEEMKVEVEGFQGGDRTSIALPKPEEELLEALAATKKPLVVVLTNGSALGIEWARKNASAIVEAWYPGEEGGSAVAETLSGRNNPAGRLPVTFYKDVSQLPPFEDYAMAGRTYRYFSGTPLFAFGYGLSYTTFAYSELTAPASLDAGAALTAEVTVTNTGKRAGDEVAQLYLSFPDVDGAPLRALRGFQRVHLEAGESRKLRFELSPRDLSMVTAEGTPIIAAGQYNLSIGGGQPDSGTPAQKMNFTISGRITLPE
jgi:beta-glucosidase